jgi:hypothetical protein
VAEEADCVAAAKAADVADAGLSKALAEENAALAAYDANPNASGVVEKVATTRTKRELAERTVAAAKRAYVERVDSLASVRASHDAAVAEEKREAAAERITPEAIAKRVDGHAKTFVDACAAMAAAGAAMGAELDEVERIAREHGLVPPDAGHGVYGIHEALAARGVYLDEHAERQLRFAAFKTSNGVRPIVVTPFVAADIIHRAAQRPRVDNHDVHLAHFEKLTAFRRAHATEHEAAAALIEHDRANAKPLVPHTPKGVVAR